MFECVCDQKYGEAGRPLIEMMLSDEQLRPTDASVFGICWLAAILGSLKGCRAASCSSTTTPQHVHTSSPVRGSRSNSAVCSQTPQRASSLQISAVRLRGSFERGGSTGDAGRRGCAPPGKMPPTGKPPTLGEVDGLRMANIDMPTSPLAMTTEVRRLRSHQFRQESSRKKSTSPASGRTKRARSLVTCSRVWFEV